MNKKEDALRYDPELLEKIISEVMQDLSDRLSQKIEDRRLEILEAEKILLTYDAKKPFTDAVNMDAKDLMLYILRKMGHEVLYSPTKSTLIFTIEKGTFQQQKHMLKSIIKELPKSEYFYYSIALISEGPNYDDYPDYKLNGPILLNKREGDPLI